MAWNSIPASANASMTHDNPTNSRRKAGRCCVFLDRRCIETQLTVSHNSRMHLACENLDEISLNTGATTPPDTRRMRTTSVVKDGGRVGDGELVTQLSTL